MLNKDIILSQKTWVRGILLIKNYKASIISSKRVVYINLLAKEQYIAQQVKRVYLTSIC